LGILTFTEKLYMALGASEVEEPNLNIQELMNRPPEISNQSIQVALFVYDIKIPSICNYPILIKDSVPGIRATTTIHGFKVRDVLVYPAAFDSWNLLGSTLAHELEVHCKQSVIEHSIFALFRGEEYSIARFEVEAYQHEIDNAERFKSSLEHIHECKAFKDVYKLSL
jgi:hypothetical protein